MARRADYRTVAGQLIDDVLATWFKGPHSYTGQDVLEISCHGNPLIAQKILDDLLLRGCRLAEPGEFTQRAFLNEKLDLTQAEAVMDIIRASSDKALALANEQLRGGLSSRITALSEEMLGVLARVEAYLDFPEDDLPLDDQSGIRSQIDGILLQINALLATEGFRHVLDDGVKIVIAGPPNAGKSSLLNRLVGKNRALVSPEPGTTRDFIEERLYINSQVIKIIDTAGIHDAQSSLEAQGIGRSLELIHEAHLILLVLDRTTHPSKPLLERLRELSAIDRVVVILNKSDLPPLPGIEDELAGFSKGPFIVASTINGHGIDAVIAAIQGRLDSNSLVMNDVVTLNARHMKAIGSVKSLLLGTSRGPLQNNQFEIVASDLREALAEIGSISNRQSNDHLLDHLFATFCIGK